MCDELSVCFKQIHYDYRKIFHFKSTGLQGSRVTIACLVSLNPLSPKSDQHQISPCNINAYSICEVMRIKDMIAQVS